MLVFSALVAGSFSLGAEAAPFIDPLALNAARFAFATGVIAALALLLGKLRREHLAQPWRFGVWGGLMATYFAMMFWALKTAEPVSLAAVFTLTPVMTALLSWLLLRQAMTARMGLALAVAATGAIWVIFGADLQAIRAFDVGKGEIIFFFGCIAHAAYAPSVPRLSRGEPGVVQTLGMLVGGTIVLAIFGLKPLLETDWTALPGIVWVTILYLTLATSALTFFLLQYAAMRLKGAKVMAYTYLVPVWVILWEGARGHGWPEPGIVLGISAILLGLALLLKHDTAALDRRAGQN